MTGRSAVLLTVLAALSVTLAAVMFVWGPSALATLAGDATALGISPSAQAALIGDLRNDQAWLAGGLALSFLAVSAVVWRMVTIRFLRPMEALAHAVRRHAQGDHTGSMPVPTADFAELSAAVAQLGTAHKAVTAETRHESARRAAAEAALRTSEERYALAIQCADEGLWEWDLASNEAHFESNWKRLLGYADGEIGSRLSEWTDRIHPDDRQFVLDELQAHIEGRTGNFECDHRLKHRDGTWRWFLVRGRAVRTASGKAYKFVGLNSDITTRKRAEHILAGIAKGLSEARGEEFFRTLVKNFAETLETEMAFIAQCIDYPTTRVRMLAWWKDGAFVDNVDFELDGTPCYETVVKGEVKLVPCNVARLFPREAGYESYLGVPIFDNAGRVLGHLATFDTKPMPDGLPRAPIFAIFAARAAVELERRVMHQ